MNAATELSEIDLIPAAYRHERALIKTLRRTAVVTVAVLVASAAAAGALRHSTLAARVEIDRLGAVAAVAEQQRAAVATLTLRKTAMQERLGVLAGLRQPAAVDDLLAAVAHAVPAQRMWFASWHFERQEPAVDGAPSEADLQTPKPAPGSSVHLQMRISGHARDHGAVSEFAEALLRDPAMREVNVPRVHRDYEAGVVSFDLLVAVEMPGTPP